MLIMIIRRRKKFVAYFPENVEIGPGMNLFNWDRKTNYCFQLKDDLFLESKMSNLVQTTRK